MDVLRFYVAARCATISARCVSETVGKSGGGPPGQPAGWGFARRLRGPAGGLGSACLGDKSDCPGVNVAQSPDIIDGPEARAFRTRGSLAMARATTIDAERRTRASCWGPDLHPGGAHAPGRRELPRTSLGGCPAEVCGRRVARPRSTEGQADHSPRLPAATAGGLGTSSRITLLPVRAVRWRSRPGQRVSRRPGRGTSEA